VAKNKIQNTGAYLVSPRKLEILTFKNLTLKPKDDYVRLRIHYCGVCGTDISIYLGKRSAEYPMSLGHEYCGTIAETGTMVTDFTSGDFIAVDLNYRCRSCSYCKQGKSNLCVKSQINLFSNRGFSHFVDVHKSYVRKLPDLEFRFLGALIEPLSCALHAMDFVHLSGLEHVLVIGCGSLGTMLTFSLTTLFPKLRLDLCDIISEKSAKLAGVFATPRNEIRSVNTDTESNMYSVIFEASGKPSGFDQACRAISKAGRIVVLSRYDGYDLTFDAISHLARKESEITFSHLNGDGSTVKSAIDLISNHWIEHLNNLIEFRSFSQIPQIFENYSALTSNKILIKIE